MVAIDFAFASHKVSNIGYTASNTNLTVLKAIIKIINIFIIFLFL